MSMGAVAAPADKRFRRAQVKPAKKSRVSFGQVWLALRIAALLALVGYGTWRGSELVLGAPALQVSRIAVTGHSRLSTGEVVALVDGLRGHNILTVSLDDWRDRLMASAWVADATLRRVLPGTVEITIRERTPLGVGRIGSRLYLVDAAGVIVDEYGPNYADLDLPIIDGLASVPASGGPVIDAERASLAARLLGALSTRPDLAERVSQIDVSEVHDAVVLLEGDTALLRLGDREFVDRLQGYIELAPALRERIADIDYVDLRFDQRLYVRPASTGRKAAQVRQQ